MSLWTGQLVIIVVIVVNNSIGGAAAAAYSAALLAVYFEEVLLTLAGGVPRSTCLLARPSYATAPEVNSLTGPQSPT